MGARHKALSPHTCTWSPGSRASLVLIRPTTFGSESGSAARFCSDDEETSSVG